MQLITVAIEGNKYYSSNTTYVTLEVENAYGWYQRLREKFQGDGESISIGGRLVVLNCIHIVCVIDKTYEHFYDEY